MNVDWRTGLAARTSTLLRSRCHPHCSLLPIHRRIASAASATCRPWLPSHPTGPLPYQLPTAQPRRRAQSSRPCTSGPADISTGRSDAASTSSSSSNSAPASPSSSKTDTDAAYQALVSELASLSPQQLREAANSRPEQLLDCRFLFWLRDQERRAAMGGSSMGLGPAMGLTGRPMGQPSSAGAGGGGLAAGTAELQEVLGRLGRELTMMREWREEAASRTLLPPLAASLAYSNLQRWRQETGNEAPQVAAGVDLEQLYRLGEQEEAKLRESLAGGGGTGPRRGASRSPIEEFTKYNRAYADLAAGVMSRVRSRLLGFRDDGDFLEEEAEGGEAAAAASAAASTSGGDPVHGNSNTGGDRRGKGAGGYGGGGGGGGAARAVLRALLRQMGGAEERATYLPEAFTPPGLQVMPDTEPSGSSISSGSGKPMFVVTTPQALVAAARARLAALTGNGNGNGGGAMRPSAAPGPTTPSATAAPTAPTTPTATAAAPPASASGVGAVPAYSGSSEGQQQQGQQQGQGQGRPLLPSGEDEVAALQELVELVEEYDRQVFSRKTPLERLGHGPVGFSGY